MPAPNPVQINRPGLEYGEISFPDISENEVLAEPVYGCWEANMTHALQRRPTDICRDRGEEKVVLGNAGVVRVLKVGTSAELTLAKTYGCRCAMISSKDDRLNLIGSLGVEHRRHFPGLDYNEERVRSDPFPRARIQGSRATVSLGSEEEV